MKFKSILFFPLLRIDFSILAIKRQDTSGTGIHAEMQYLCTYYKKVDQVKQSIQRKI